MIRKTFINRDKELSSLNKRFKKDGFEFIVITGRRRVGKTRLLQEFSNNKQAIFFMCEERKWQYNLDKFNNFIGKFFDIPTPNFSSFRESFEYIAKENKDLVIVIDEFSYLIKNNDEILGEFQGIVDEILSDTNINLILSGSAVSMMKKRVLNRKSPLYGRTTSQLYVQPFRFPDLLDWFEKSDVEDIIKIFGVCDGIPKYLEFFEGEDVEQEIKENIFSPDAFLFREPKLLLEEELREPETYYQILEAMSLGHTRTTEIANYSYMEAKNISSYLSILQKLGFIQKEKSILAKKRKRGIYKIKDNFFKFWFRFISPNFANIENWQYEGAFNEFKRYFDQYLGEVFEQVCKQFVNLEYDYPSLGRWWYKEDEIDIVGLDQRENEILFGECKWTNKKVSFSLLNDLKEKAGKVRWNNKDRKERYILFSKNGFTNNLKQYSDDNNHIETYSMKKMKKLF
ncbi:MAG: ATP-binding protein [Thermoplasmatota archaeon]